MESEINQSLDKIVESLKKLEMSTKSIEIFTNQMKNMNESLNQLSETTSQLDATKVLSYFQNFNLLVTTLKNIGGLKNTLQDVKEAFSNVITYIMNFVTNIGISTTIVEGLSAALTFLSAHPIIAVIGAIGLVVGALAIFDSANDDSTEAIYRSSEAIEAQKERLESLNDEIRNMSSDNKQSIASIISDYDLLSDYIDRLEGISVNGIVDSENLQEAQFYIEQINKIMPDSISLTKDGKLNIEGSTDALKANIEMLKKKAVAEKQAEKYAEIMSKELEIKREYNQAEQEYFGTLQEIVALENRNGELNDEERERLEYLNERLPSLKENYTNVSYSMSELNKASEDFNLSMEALNGTVEDQANSLVSSWTSIDENGRASFSSMAAALNEFNIQHTELSNSNSEKAKEEAEVYSIAGDKMIEKMVQKSLQYGLSYSQMIEEAEKSGVHINEIEKKKLKESYDYYDKNYSDKLTKQLLSGDQTVLNEQIMFSKLSEVQKAQLLEAYERFKLSGENTGYEYMAALLISLKNNNGEVNEQTQKMIDDLEAMAYDADPAVYIKALPPSSSSINKIENLLDNLSRNRKMTISVGVSAAAKAVQIIGASIKGFASGGFPDTGELFVAREAGPELVGRINGKTAIANNDQIVSGISSGVFNAVTSAMKGINTNGHMNIHATFVMDGEVIGKQVIKYHNGVVNRTGHSPLMI